MPYLFSFYVPESHLDLVKEAIFKTGAGELGEYRYCSWEIKGEGQYMPLTHSRPFKGEVNTLSKEIEYKVEIHCQDDIIEKAVGAMKDTHPYEVPAYHVIKIVSF